MKGSQVINPRELITIYPENLPSNIRNLQNHIHHQKQSSQAQRVQRMKSEKGLQIKEMDELLCKLLWGQLQSMGLFTEKHSVITDLKTKTGPGDLYDRWLEESTAILAKKNYLQYDGKSCTVTDTIPMAVGAVWKQWDRQKGPGLKDPNKKAQVVLLEATLRALPEILTGKRLATDILFPNSSMELVEGIYKNNPIADYFNEVLADTLVAYVQERLQQDSSVQIRILEIGAGTGGTSAMIFQKLQPYQDQIQEYCYTDISKSFLMHAQKEYGAGNPYLTYQMFDVETPIAGQGISAGGYDIAIAANVLHATKNIRQTLRNTKAALKKNGLILLNELSENALFLHLTFGLLEGWWLYEDPELRIPGCPGLCPQTWQEVLEREGFQSVFFPAQEAHDLGQAVIVGESDGVVRLKQPHGMGDLLVKNSKLQNTMPLSKKKAGAVSITNYNPRNYKPNGIDASRQSCNHEAMQYHSHSPISNVTDQMVEDYVKETIIEKLSESLKVDIDVIDVDESFADYGLDSITGVHLVQVINQTLMIELETTSLFDYSSVNQLTTYILSQYKDLLIPALGQKVKPIDINHELTSDIKEAPTVYSYSKRFFRKSVLPEPGIKNKEESTGDSIQKDPIAIIGMSGRFAKSKTVNDLWEHLAKGTDLIEEVSRWDLSQYYPDSTQEEVNYCNYGSFLEDIDQFDPLFFNISGLEATYMDPQQRLFLEESWKALEDAGYAGTGVQGHQCGVYVGCIVGDYKQLFGDNPPAQAMWGNAGSVIPARIAYYLNLQGPTVAIDTACSSSLVATHLACQSLWTRETGLALAGGVFIQSTPGFYMAANRAGMLSPTGRCFAFDQRADGFVPGEGLGVVVLKRLKEAIADGDHIYGVIRGSGINQDGTTNGITAPSANSQQRLLCYVYDTFNIHPEHIRMVETHGTGTELGDPIEYEALTRAFGKYTKKKEYCAIGSVKTNLGHTQIAAGVAGLIKILLSLKHKQIPPSLHYQSGNSNIRFKESPFYVNTSLKDWDIVPNSKRCAVISSFGFSGTNAHMAVEEAPEVERQHLEKPGYLMVLSARTFKQLRQQVEQIVEYCEQESHLDADCGNMSYTLLLGRKHLNHRLACVVRSQEELVKLFKKWLEKGKVLQIYVSELHENDHRKQPSLKRYGNQCIQNCQNTNPASDYLEHLSTIADLYIQGYELEFEQLFSNEPYSRISLPTYPFARERYWVPEASNDSLMTASRPGQGSVEKQNPLLYRIDPQKTAKLESGIVFETLLTPKHSSVIGHIVGGQPILSVAAHIEMIRAVMKEVEGNIPIEIEEIHWLQPIVVMDEVSIHLVLRVIDKHQYDFRIQRHGSDPITYSQGKVKVYEDAKDVDVYIDYQALQKTGILRKDMKQLYEGFSQLGIEYKDAFCSLKTMWVNKEEVLGELELNESYQESGYGCHPGLFDSALQARIGLSKDKSGTDLAISMKSVKITGDMPSRIFSYIKRSKEGKHYQLALLEPTGKVIVQIQQLSTRKLKNQWNELMYLPIWEEQSLLIPVKQDKPHTVLIVYSESSYKFAETILDYYRQNKTTKKVIQVQLSNQTEQVSEEEWRCDINNPKGFKTCLPGYGSIDCLYFISGCQGEKQPIDFDALANSQQDHEIQLLRLVKFLKQNDIINNHIDCTIITQDNYRITDIRINPYGGGITGLAYSIAQGDHRFSVKNIDISSGDIETPGKRDALLRLILNEDPSDRGEVIKFKSGSRYKQVFLKLDWNRFKKESRLPGLSGLKTGGVYVILGGSGTVGSIITRYLMQKYNAKVIWIGRKPKTANIIQKKIESLRISGETPLYIQADATSLSQMEHAVTKIKRQFSTVNGAIFSGLVFNFENSINKTNENEFLEILNVKTIGSVNFYHVFQDQPLDFMCYFSSAQAFSFSGAANLSAYATGITFSDTFIQFIRGTSKFPVGIINWGFWKSSMEGTFLSKNSGLLEDREGFDCFEHFTRLLQGGVLNQVACLRVSRPVRELMNYKEEEIISICEKRSDSMIRSLMNDNKVNEHKVEILIKSSDPEEFNEWISKLLFVQMRQLGLFRQRGVPEEVSTLRKKAGVIDKYDRWMKECLGILEAKGCVQCEAGQVKVLEKAELEDEENVWKEWNLIKESYLNAPGWEAQVKLVDVCLQKLPEILRGNLLATDILFPNSSMEMVEGIYKNNARSDYFNTVVADVTAAYVRQRLKANSQTKVRMIEIGAGIGGTSAMVFAKLKPYVDHIEYCYTDISKSFLMFAEEQYGPVHPYLKYKRWNIEKPLTDQGIEVGSYDMAIATDVLHATKNIRQTIRNTKAALKTNGILLLSEGTQKTIFATLTFGLLDGWWLYEDEPLRIPGSPLLYPGTWQEVLEEEGFRQIHFPAESAHTLGQHIIAAESDGVVRQKVENNLIREEGKDEINQDLSPSTFPQSIKEVTIPTPGVSAESIEEYVKRMIFNHLAKSLKISRESIASNVAFSDYGVDSIIGVNFVKQLNHRLGVTMNSSILFDFTTVDRLTGYIIKTYKEQIQKHMTLSSYNISHQKIVKVKSMDGLFKSDSILTEDNYNSVPQKTDEEAKVLLSDHFTLTEENTDKSKSTEIAIIGMTGQFPDAKDVDTFWQNLIRGHDAVHELPSQYLYQSQYFSSEKQSGETYYNWGGILEDRDCFDPLFFNISPREAESMNPHQRLILQESWKAIEDAGYNPKGFGDSQVGMFIGAEPTGYFHESFTGFSDAIIASRLSYFLNLNGPAMVVNTGCSSSAVAIHLACESLRNGESSLAIAGGVFANMDQITLVTLTQIGMLSPSGRCYTFDESGDGTVMSEGVGVVVLKRLRDAISAGDHIYGVIKGSGVNQDGASNGITAPNGVAQEQLITSVYKRYRINPEEITYIEAHGTGTKLGDPIEANALVRAFKQFTNQEQYCAVGSAKSHIGHTGAAAGVIGLIKILLSLRHHKTPGLIHFKKLNPLIEFKNSAFYVNTKLLEWRSKSSKPLMAALNSFGHSGTNVHFVVREYIPPDEMSRQTPIPLNVNEITPVIIPLSAKNKYRLRDYVSKLLGFLKNSISHDVDYNGLHNPGINLAAIAYTLQIGREAMEERIVFLVKNIPGLITKLEAFIEGKEEIDNCWQGQVKQFKDMDRVFATDEELNETVEKWIVKSQLRKIAELWAQGFAINWELLYREIKPKPQRISLPTYTFARERYWVPKNRGQRTEDRGQKIGSSVQIIHPLLHQNTSDFSEQRFSSTFTGQEFFLADHVVKGQRVLPGVATLEMARAAVEQAAGALLEGQTGIRLKNVGWVRPIAVGEQPVQVHIELFPGDNGLIAYEIYSESQDVGAEPVVHSRGSAVLYPVAECTDVAEVAQVANVPEVPTLDLQALQTQCSKSSLSSTQCYETFRVMGVDHGPSLRGVKVIYVGPDQVLAKLSLPSSISDTGDQFVLHPSLMDSALQASISLAMGPGDTDSKPPLSPFLPFAVQELEIFGNFSSSMWSLIRYSDGSAAEDKVQKLDVDWCDDQGTICARMKGFTARVLEGEVGSVGVRASATFGTLMLQPCWKELAVAHDAEATTPAYDQHLVMLCEPGEGNVSRESIETQMNGVRCLFLQSQQEGIEERFKTYTAQVFEEIQSILKEKPKGKVLIQVVVSTQNEQQLFFGLSGLLKTAQLENPKLIGQLIGVELREDSKGIIEKLGENSRSPIDNQVRYQDGKRWIAGWSEVEVSQEEVSFPWKDRGIYLITGGGRGLGLLFAREIVQQVKETTLILTGRSPLDEDKQSQLKELQTLGTCARIEYKQVDVTQKKAVVSLIQSILEDFGSLHGIIHSAGVIGDNFIIKKTGEELQEVLSPKVTGLVNLDQASKGLPLDFFIFFSSISGVIGNPGQADYSAANAFMDAYARYRNALVASKERQGQTLSINWPLWEEGGMNVDEETKKMMRQDMGLVAMQTSTGIQALYQGLTSGKDQVMVIEGDLKRLYEAFLGKLSDTGASKTPAAPDENKAVPAIGQDLLREKATNYFKKLLSSVIKLPAHRIEADAPLEKYGIDSIMVMQLTNQLEKTFGSLSKTLFFEYQNIRELTGYFLESYRDQLAGLLGIGEKPEDRGQRTEDRRWTEPVKPAVISRSRRRQRFATPGTEPRQEKSTGALDIAIIGLSGRYPQARNIQEFWKNLRDGKDCITEIPKDRWDHSLYFDENKNKPGKTYSKWGGFLEGVANFDPLFFNIPPLEAEIMDPQERLFLECVFETLEDAGYTREALGLHQGFGLEGNVGVYVGVMYEEYQLYGSQEAILGRPIALSGNPSSIANRVSYFCNFHGPSMAVDTMCSSSLTAIHLACQSLQRGGCELTIAGGVNVSIHPNKYLLLGQGKFASSKGQCESFGQGGDGYVPGEGVGAVLLKPLSKAIADKDHIYGIIKTTAINHGGKTNGYTVPNPNAQASVIRRAFKEARISPRTINYIEAHGTGTSLGDPIEIAGLTKTFREFTKDKQFCAIGSVKSNIGHCESAAGIAGVTKVLLQLQHGQLVPSLHSEVLNPNINFSNTPFVVQQELAEWKRPVVKINGETREYPRRAGISSFGAGGSNAHVVIEEYIPKDPEPPQITITTQNPAIVVLSAKNKERLQVQVQRLLAAIASSEQQLSDISLADMAYTLQVGREAMEERLAVIVGSIKVLREKLEDFLEGQDDIENLYRGQAKHNKETLAVLTADEDLQKGIDAWIAKKKYAKLLDLWVKGLIFDWNKLYGDPKPKPHQPRRISLPTYPFAGKRYWVSGYETRSVSSSAEASSLAASIYEDRPVQRTMCFLKKQWVPGSDVPSRSLNRTIALLTTQETKGLATLLAQHFPGSQVLHLHDLESQLQQPEQDWKNYDGCIDLVGCGTDRNQLMDWLAWPGQLIEQGHKEGLMVLGVTKGLESYQNSDINLSGASRVGLYRMLQSEYSHLRSRHMDADPSLDDPALARQIAAEFLMDSQEPEICYRKGKRYRACLQEMPGGDDSARTLVFPEEHVLWITGGTRGLGYLCAQHFVTHYGIRRLVLTGRDLLPPRDQWDSYQQQNTSIAQKIRGIQALEAQGAQVQVLSVSLIHEQAVKESLEEIKSTMGPIGGIIHSAGIIDLKNPAFIRKSIDGIQQVLAPKVTGLDILVQSLKNEPLQFFILFSSVAAIIPGLAVGQSDYAMANAYMDYAAEANLHACPMVSIQWPSWKETGMGEVKTRAYEQTGLLSLTDTEGLQLLDYILSKKPGPVVLPAVVNPVLWKPDQLMQRTIQKNLSIPAQALRPQQQTTVDASRVPDDLLQATQQWLISLFSRELKIDASKLELDTSFQDYGLDSILLAQLLQKINQEAALDDLDPSILYEYPTIESFAAWLASTHASSLSTALGISSPGQPHPPTQDSLSPPPLPSISSQGRISIQGLQRSSPIHKAANRADVAVIGLSCRFPGAGTLEEYWQLLSAGRSAIGPVPRERWGYDNHFFAGLIDNITHFDPKFFLVPEDDARAMDPQALVVLEESLNLFYHAGYSHQEIKGKSVGVFLGGRSQHQPDETNLRQARNPIVAVGQNYLAANISQFFDLRGPSLVLDTACSSALVGMNMAIQALHSGEIDSALVGGVSLLNSDGIHRMFQQRNLLSLEPCFHIFDQRAGGVVLGEGVGMVLLKTVNQALADGDHIYAVIKALAINNDGRTAGPATPNLQAQKEVLQKALAKSGKKPEEISYIEANGSGSQVTDLLELKAIQSIYRSSNTVSIPCGLGSMKPNIGHPLCAEGIAGFIKAALMLQHRQWVPFLSGQQPMRHYDLESSPFYFCRELTGWKDAPRVAAINCFADGGTNAHVILEAWEPPASRPIKRHPLPPPELVRYDVHYAKGVTSSFMTIQGNGDGYEISVWKEKIEEL